MGKIVRHLAKRRSLANPGPNERPPVRLFSADQRKDGFFHYFLLRTRQSPPSSFISPILPALALENRLVSQASLLRKEENFAIEPMFRRCLPSNPQGRARVKYGDVFPSPFSLFPQQLVLFPSPTTGGLLHRFPKRSGYPQNLASEQKLDQEDINVESCERREVFAPLWYNYRYVYVKDLANRAPTFGDKTQASFKKWGRGERKRKEKTKVTAREERYGIEPGEATDLKGALICDT